MRTISFIIVSISAFLTPYWLFVICATLYLLWHRSWWEVCLLGFVIDVVFGSSVPVFSYMYTTAAVVLAVLAMLIKPYLSVYDHTYDV